jgi:hypothetical protein
MDDPHTIHTLTWQGIEIEARYCPLRWRTIAHLEILSVKPDGAPLPISETGYKSWFHEPGTIEASGMDLVAFVTTGLDQAATSREWKTHLENARQGMLF